MTITGLNIKKRIYEGKKVMNKLLILALLSIFLNAGQSDVKEKKYEEMTEAELIAKFMKSDKEIKEIDSQTKDQKKLGKTLDEIGNKLGVDKK